MLNDVHLYNLDAESPLLALAGKTSSRSGYLVDLDSVRQQAIYVSRR